MYCPWVNHTQHTVIKCEKPYIGARRECEICVLEAYEIMKAKGDLLRQLGEEKRKKRKKGRSKTIEKGS